MNPPVTGREALLIEALGEMTQVLDKTAALVPAMKASQAGVIKAMTQLEIQMCAMEGRMKAMADNARTGLDLHLTRRSQELTLHSVETQTRALEEAARAMFNKEVGPALQRVVQPLNRLYELVMQRERPWTPWLTHAATALVSAIVAALLASGVLRH